LYSKATQRRCGGIEAKLHEFLTLTVDRNKFSFTLQTFYHGKYPPGTTREWVGPTVGLNLVAKRKIPLLQGVNPRSFSSY
jgi:hypothetical protein